MQYTKLTEVARAQLRVALARMPDDLAGWFGALSASEARQRPAAEAFSPVEHAWHLADLEHEGFGRRIERRLHEDRPVLADFDGAAIALERDYRRRSIRAGVTAFAAARAANLARLAQLTSEQWERSGTQQGVGVVALCDLPGLMHQHDGEHRAQI
jgi:hypothetical protein